MNCKKKTNNKNTKGMMSGGHHQAVLSTPERARYEGYFASADVDQDGVIGAADAAWFLQLGLEKSTLGEVRNIFF